MADIPDDPPEKDLPQENASAEEEPEPNRFTTVFLAVVVEGGLAGLAVFLGFLFEQNPLSRFTPDFAGLGWGLLAAAPMLLGFLVMNRWPIGPLRRIKSFTESMVLPFMRPCTRTDLLGISCLAGLGEEMFFRGWAQDYLAGALPLGYAILAASLLFGLLHAITPTYALLAALIGGYLGWLYALTGNLLAPIVAHAAYDFIVLWIVVRDSEAADAQLPPAQ